MELILTSKIPVATLSLTPEREPSASDLAKIKALVVKTFEEHIKVDLPDLTYEVEVVPGARYQFIISACFTFETPVVDEINKILKEFGL